ncbi:MAG TPA: S8 family peptidase [Thermoanaerobaculia bacterium]|nr:S8 family peptidase [Thermoanaerobaculia bacterium]
MNDVISKRPRKTASRNRWMQPLLCLVISMLLAGMANAGELIPRRAALKGDNYSLPQQTLVERLVVKFHEGTRVRWRDKVLIALDRDERERAEINRLGLTDAQIDADVTLVQHLIALDPRSRGIGRLLSTEEDTLEKYKIEGEQLSGEELADMNLYFEVQLPPGTAYGKIHKLLLELNQLPSIEIAYAEPPTAPAVAEVAPVFSPELKVATPNFQSQQGYLNPAPQGIDALYAWTVPGGAGAGVRIVDIERGWNVTHEDLPPLFYQGGSASTIDIDHGTAVLGEMVAKSNGLGVTGISYQAQAGTESWTNQGTSSAITNASLAAGAGNILLVEVHRLGPLNGSPCTCNLSQCDYIALEYWQADYDAIASATANGRIVVEAAGNGSSNLDDPAYGNLFNRSVRDSKAILVAASLSTNRSPTCWTNWGSRIDAHGWGENVVTLGYGDLFNGGTNQLYTATFGGTSSASPIVTGAAASLQGAARAAGLGNRSPLAMRQLIASTGTAQDPNAKNIGPRPNLRAALNQLLGPLCTANSTTLCLQGNRFKAQLTWRNGGPSSPGSAMPYSNEAGFFHFGGPTNPEVGVKILDGRPVNGRFWVYHSTLTSLEYTLTITDMTNGAVKTYFKPSGSLCGAADVGAFALRSPGSSEKTALSLDVEPLTATGLKAVCTPTATSVCLLGNRFRVEVKRSGVAQPAVPLTSQAGVFWFFSSTNPEVTVKVLDGTPVNGRYWVFFGPLTDQSYQVVVTDTATGTVKTYNGPPPFCGTADTSAF